jgi:hypothetical protein
MGVEKGGGDEGGYFARELERIEGARGEEMGGEEGVEEGWSGPIEGY